MKWMCRESFITEMMESRMYVQLVLGLMLQVILLSFADDQPHPCDRNCVRGARPKKCIYNWTMEHFVSLSVDCMGCPYKIADCFRVDCVPVDGVQRMITVINRKMPGPSINVCRGDIIVVNLHNMAGAEVTTIHWHGLNQVGTPYMDGVPMVTQCPIHPFNSFQYIFEAADVGTFFYHSHIGFQRTDGVNGMIVVRQPKEFDPNRFLYDIDLSKHQIMLADWINKSGEQMYRNFYHTAEDYANYLSILVNGRGRTAEFRNISTGTIHSTPYSSFVVKKGLRYRFRVCSNANWVCPIEISVVDHNLTVVGTDGDSVRPIVVKSIVINPGERFDFVINANRPIATYWMMFRGLLRCEVRKAVGRAILKYETANDVEPPEPISNSPGLVLNPVNDPFNTSRSISLFQLRSHTPPDASIRRVQPDIKMFIPFNFYPNLNPEFSAENALLPMVNSRAFLAPPSPLLSTYDKIPQRFFCDNTRNCSKEFCQCTYILKVQIGWVVEIILIDEGPTRQLGVSHPWHMHGHHFRCMGGSLMNANNTVANIKKMDAEGKIQRNFFNPVLKDTISVPHGGFSVIRFHATNTGFWALHCHVELHTETGMMLVLQVGDWKVFPKPPFGFPTCGDFPKAQ